MRNCSTRLTNFTTRRHLAPTRLELPLPTPLSLSHTARLVTVLNVYLCFDLKSIAVWGVALITPVRLPIVQFVPVTRINTKYILYLVYTALHHKVLCGLSKGAFNTLPQRKRKELCSLSRFRWV